MIKTEWVEALDQVRYKDWRYGLYVTPDYEFLQIRFEEGGETQYCRRWLITSGMSADDVVKTAWMATLAAEEHEARERFRYKGRAVFGPHVGVDYLAEGVGKLANLDVKTYEPHAGS